jgi:hypothetical protein
VTPVISKRKLRGKKVAETKVCQKEVVQEKKVNDFVLEKMFAKEKEQKIYKPKFSG